jgi:hypothetical protein
VANNKLAGGISGLVAYGADAGSTLVAADNSITGQSTYHIANGDAGSSINAESNWFGTTAGHVIAAKIVGNVDYSPWRVDGTDTSTAAGFQPTGVATGTRCGDDLWYDQSVVPGWLGRHGERVGHWWFDPVQLLVVHGCEHHDGHGLERG